MTKWRCISALLVLSGAFGCATATNGGDPLGSADSAGAEGGAAPVPTGSGGSGLGGGASGGTLSASSGASGSPSAGSSSVGSSGGVSSSSGASSGGSPSTGGRASGGAAGVGQGGAAGNAGTLSGGTSGTSSSSGAPSGGTAGSAPSSGPCASPKDVMGGKSDNLGTTGAVCMRTTETFNTIGCSNWGGRTIKVNGVLATCNVKTTFAPMIDGFNYFEVSAGDVDFAAFVWYTS